MLLEEFQGPAPGFFRGLRPITVRSVIRIEGMWRVGVDFVFERLAIFLHLLREPRDLRRDRFVEFAVVSQNRVRNVLDGVKVGRNWTIIDYRS